MSAGRDLPQIHNVTYDQVGPLLDKSWHLRRHASLATDSLVHAATRQFWKEGSRSIATSMTELLADQIAVKPDVRDNTDDSQFTILTGPCGHQSRACGAFLGMTNM